METENVNDKIIIKSAAKKLQVAKILERTRKYCLRSKKEIEYLLNDEVQIQVLMKLTTKES